MLQLFCCKFLYTSVKLPVDNNALFIEHFFSKKYCSSFKVHILHNAYALIILLSLYYLLR